MIDKLEGIAERYHEVEQLISDPDIMKDLQRYKELMQEHSQVREMVEEFEKYKQVAQEVQDAEALIGEEADPEMREMAKEELQSLEEKRDTLTDHLKTLLIPKDPLDGKNIIMEIRAGTGGEEAALFAAELYRMYTHFAEKKRWKQEILSMNETGIGGIKEIIVSIAGKD